LRVMVGLVRSNGGHEEEEDRAREEQTEQPAITSPCEVDPQRRKRPRIFDDLTVPQERANRGKEKACDEKARRDQIREYANVWIAEMRERIQQQQQREGENAANDDDQSRQAQPVSEDRTAPGRRHGCLDGFHTQALCAFRDGLAFLILSETEHFLPST